MADTAVGKCRVLPSENIEKCCRIVKFFAVEIQQIPPTDNVGFCRRNIENNAVGKRRFSPSKNNKKARPIKSVAPLSRRRFGGF